MFREYTSNIEKKFFELCTKVVEENGYNLYDMEYLKGNSTLRVYIVNPETNTAVIEDCIKVDQAFSPYCEEADWMPASLTLEVSSPGVYRQLISREHLQSAVGEKVQFNLKKNLNESGATDLPKKVGKEKKIIALLKEVKDDELEIEIDNKLLNLKLDNIKKANLEPELF